MYLSREATIHLPSTASTIGSRKRHRIRWSKLRRNIDHSFARKDATGTPRRARVGRVVGPHAIWSPNHGQLSQALKGGGEVWGPPSVHRIFGPGFSVAPICPLRSSPGCYKSRANPQLPPYQLSTKQSRGKAGPQLISSSSRFFFLLLFLFLLSVLEEEEEKRVVIISQFRSLYWQLFEVL